MQDSKTRASHPVGDQAAHNAATGDNVSRGTRAGACDQQAEEISPLLPDPTHVRPHTERSAAPVRTAPRGVVLRQAGVAAFQWAASIVSVCV